MRVAIAVLVAIGSVAAAQQPTIEVRKIRTVVDRNGRSFTRAPAMAAALSGGRYALQEINALPVIVDSLARSIKFFQRGEGPGELTFNATSMAVGSGDTLYVGNQRSFSVFGPDLKFVRSIDLDPLHAGWLVPLRNGFVLSAQRIESPYMTSLHLLKPSGDIVRSFVRDTFDSRALPRPAYRVAAASDGNVWTAQVYTHHIAKWSLDGRPLIRILVRPTWFDNRRSPQDGHPYVRGIAEADGILWVMSSVPVPNYRQIMGDATKAKGRAAGRGIETDGRFIPNEKLSTTRIEAYDAATGRLLTDLPIKAHGIGLLGGRQLMLYSTGPNDEPQLEVWEMTLKR